MRGTLTGALTAIVLAASGCGIAGESGVASDAPLAVYVSVPLSGPDASEGKAIEAQVREALEAAGGKAGDHPIDLRVLDSTDGNGAISLAKVGANARAATEDADAIAYIGDLGAASATSLPITDLAQMAQVVMGTAPTGIDVDNQVQLPAGSKQPGAAAISLLLPAIEKAGSENTSRDDVRRELRP